MVTDDSDLPVLAARSPESHKGDFGRALIVGGSRGMAGAVSLAGMAALRSGAGLVSLAVPDVCLETVASFEPSYTTVALPSDGDGKLAAASCSHIEDLAREATVIACGPGLGRSDALTDLMRRLYKSLPVPMVFDADGLNALAAHPQGLADPGGTRILTPHPGEFQRLVGRSGQSRRQMADQAVAMAGRYEIIVVLKGHGTLITDGQRAQRNATGNPGMATGGSGDVLTGVVTALLCQNLDPFSAARLGVHVHGLAGDLAATQRTEIAMIARDLIDCLPEAFRQGNAPDSPKPFSSTLQKPPASAGGAVTQ